MSNIIETGIEQEKWSMTLGAKTANTVPFRWIAKEFQEQRGPVWCQTCKKDGSFEGIFYASCDRCSLYEGRCQCVYCIAAKKDGHQHLTRRANIFRFVKELQMVVEDLRRDYPRDEYGIVAEGIETGFYILNLHTAKQYELMLLDISLPFEVSQLSIIELNYRWNPEKEVPETVIKAAIKAAKRLNIVAWVKELWSGTKYEAFLFTAEEFTPEEQCMNELDKKICSPEMKTSCFETAEEDDDDFDVQCQECETWISVKETDKKGYCLDCQNPEYDPVWPMGD